MWCQTCSKSFHSLTSSSQNETSSLYLYLLRMDTGIYSTKILVKVLQSILDLKPYLAFRSESDVHPWWLWRCGGQLHHPVDWWETSSPATGGSENTATKWRGAPCHQVGLFILSHWASTWVTHWHIKVDVLLDWSKGTRGWRWNRDKPGSSPVLLSLHETLIPLPLKSSTYLRVSLLKGSSSWRWVQSNMLLCDCLYYLFSTSDTQTIQK